ncbi:MAG TPA: substrate-binding domain-containing protein, partial [Clostridia bacterium]|nr:substrate-binding domain-containing protein [Clostridia bacterium]
ILIKGKAGLPLTEERTAAALQALANNGVKATPAVDPIYANFLRNEAMAQLIPILRSGVKFDAIIANNDAMALGAIEALEYLKMNPAKTVVVGIDATEPAVRALLEGKLAMTVYQNRKGRAAATMTVVNNMLNREPFNKGIENLTSPNDPFAILYPYEPITRYNIPSDLYF